jgi:hypothetical protein
MGVQLPFAAVYGEQARGACAAAVRATPAKATPKAAKTA